MLFLAAIESPACIAGTVALVQDGKSRCCIVVQEESAFKEPRKFNWSVRTRLLQMAAEDVASYLGKMSGAKVPMGPQPVAGLIPIYVGCPPHEVQFSRTTEFGDAYVVDVTDSHVILHGESRRAVYYAVSHLLHEQGVRWYGPGEMAEVCPTRETIVLQPGKTESAPDFVTRRLACSGPEQTRWMYRNRLGEPTIPAGHSLHAYCRTLPGWTEGPIGRAKHPDYYAQVNGKPAFINLANPDVARLFAANVAIALKAGPRQGPGGKVSVNSLSVTPDGGHLDDERPEVRALNSGERDSVLGMPVFSDAWFGFLNRVCGEIEKQSPGLEFSLGSLAYLNYVTPPRRIKLDPRIIPVIAPITFNRFTSMGIPGAPTSEMLEQVVRGWTAVSPRVAMYLYNYNVADMAMPYSRRIAWTRDLPKLAALGVRDIAIDSQPNWHTMMPGNYVAARLLWDVKTNVPSLLDEYYPAYYGPAATAMRRYDTTLENAYETTKVFAGSVWGMHRILTPSVMRELDQALTESERLVRGRGVFERRVEPVRISLKFAQHWFAAREALNRFDMMEAEKQGAAFLANYQTGSQKFPLFFGPTRPGSPSIEQYFELFHWPALQEAGRIARDRRIVYRFPDEWQAHLEEQGGGAKSSGKIPDAVKDAWRPLKTFSATLDEQGLPFFRGVIWYRHEFELPGDVAEGTPLKLWFGGLDSGTHVWLNGRDLGGKYIGKFGTHEVDLTAAINPGGKNVLLVAVNNTFPNTLGTGGILRPVLIHAPGQQPKSKP